jgi:hypothetical protein
MTYALEGRGLRASLCEEGHSASVHRVRFLVARDNQTELSIDSPDPFAHSTRIMSA